MRAVSRFIHVSLLATAVISPALAQQDSHDASLPDARPGECYAKVVAPPKMVTRTENLIMQPAIERIEIIPARFETVEEQVLVREEAEQMEIMEARFSRRVEKIEIREAENQWVVRRDGEQVHPARERDLEAMTQSGIDIESAEAGACFVEYYKDATYRKEILEVLIRPEHQRLVAEEVEYETVEEQVLIKEASTRILDVPAVFRTETESVLVEPARSEWKAGRGPIEKIDNSTGEIMCLVEIPARYEDITRTVLDKPATTRTVEVPAEYKTVAVERVAKPAGTRSETVEAEYMAVETRIRDTEPAFFWLSKSKTADQDAVATGQEVCLIERPAEYREVPVKLVDAPASVKVSPIPEHHVSVEVQRLVAPASERRVSVPQRTRTVTTQVQVEPARMEWRKVLCETNMTPEVIRSLQEALEVAGFEPGPADGVLGLGTLKAIEAFQIAENIDRGGITYETLEKLNVEP